MRLTRGEKRGLFCLAVEILDAERGGRAQPVGEERVQTSGKSGGRMLHDYAIDFLSCLSPCPWERQAVVGTYLGQEDSEKKPLGRHEKAALRRFWGRVRAKRGLISAGLRFLERLDT